MLETWDQGVGEVFIPSSSDGSIKVVAGKFGLL